MRLLCEYAEKTLKLTHTQCVCEKKLATSKRYLYRSIRWFYVSVRGVGQ